MTICTCLSCLALPIPASILMLGAGSFAAAGDLSLPGSVVAALAGAEVGDQVGDQVGYLAGLWAGAVERLGARAAPIGRASDLLARRGGIAVFLSR